MSDYEKELPIAIFLQDTITIRNRDPISFLLMKDNMMPEEDWDIGNTSYIFALFKKPFAYKGCQKQNDDQHFCRPRPLKLNKTRNSKKEYLLPSGINSTIDYRVQP